MWTWQRLTAACWMLRCALRRRMRAAHRSCVLCEHQTCRFRGAVVARRVRDSTDCLHALVPFFVRRLEHCACESALSARPLAVACGTCICNHTRSQRQPPSSQGGWQSLAEGVWGPVVSPRSSTEGPACSPGLMPRCMGLLTRAGICCREV